MPPVAEPLRPEVAHTLAAFLTRAAERGGDVAITHGSTAIHMPAAMALSLDASAAVAAAIAEERAAVVAYVRSLAKTANDEPQSRASLAMLAADIERGDHREGR